MQLGKNLLFYSLTIHVRSPGDSMSDTQRQPEIWLMGLGCDEERSAKVRDYLTHAGYQVV